ncbi:MAG: hypothetical protein HC814_04680 [Rhodobacteraceae bacterium]|nr:hypothetical protein [Paracoccaceae bacterium]
MIGKLKQAQLRFGDDLPLSVAEPKSAKWTPTECGGVKEGRRRGRQGEEKEEVSALFRRGRNGVCWMEIVEVTHCGTNAGRIVHSWRAFPLFLSQGVFCSVVRFALPLDMLLKK